MTRAEFVTMTVRALALKGEGKSKFTNLSGKEWYANNISLAKDAGLIEGTSYEAEKLISRAEMTEIISKAHALLNKKPLEFSGKIKFTDVPNNSEYAKYIGYAKENGLINGFSESLFKPSEVATRAQVMKVIGKLINAVK